MYDVFDTHVLVSERKEIWQFPGFVFMTACQHHRVTSLNVIMLVHSLHYLYIDGMALTSSAVCHMER